MRKFLFALCVLLGLAGCGDDNDMNQQNPEQAAQQVQACYAKGGVPGFKTNDYAEIVAFYGCGGVKP